MTYPSVKCPSCPTIVHTLPLEGIYVCDKCIKKYDLMNDNNLEAYKKKFNAKSRYDWGKMARDPKGEKLLKSVFKGIFKGWNDVEDNENKLINIDKTANECVEAFKTR